MVLSDESLFKLLFNCDALNEVIDATCQEGIKLAIPLWFWAGFAGPLKRVINRWELRRTNSWPFIHSMYSSNMRLFQQDNADCYLAQVSRNWLEDHSWKLRRIAKPPNGPSGVFIGHSEHIYSHTRSPVQHLSWWLSIAWDIDVTLSFFLFWQATRTFLILQNNTRYLIIYDFK